MTEQSKLPWKFEGVHILDADEYYVVHDIKARTVDVELIVDSVNNTQRYREALERAALTFRRYEKLHKEKGTEDALIKARDNAELANVMEKALKNKPEEK